MKRYLNVRIVLVIILSLALVSLSACGTRENTETIEGENDNSVTEFEESTSQEPVGEDAGTSETDINYDIESKLSKAESEAEALEKVLYEDETLKQSDMNDLSYEIYMVWDNLLNDMWQAMKESLDEETMNKLLIEQREWIDEKEMEVKKAGDAFAGGSMAPLASNQKAAELTKARVYELVPYLSNL